MDDTDHLRETATMYDSYDDVENFVPEYQRTDEYDTP